MTSNFCTSRSIFLTDLLMEGMSNSFSNLDSFWSLVRVSVEADRNTLSISDVIIELRDNWETMSWSVRTPDLFLLTYIFLFYCFHHVYITFPTSPLFISDTPVNTAALSLTYILYVPAPHWFPILTSFVFVSGTRFLAHLSCQISVRKLVVPRTSWQLPPS